MEDHREDTVAFYWLVQYQRLMDRKPQALIDKVRDPSYAEKRKLPLHSVVSSMSLKDNAIEGQCR